MPDVTEALTAALRTRSAPPSEVTSYAKPVVDEPWVYADACAVVDARSKGACECPRPCGLAANVHHHIAGRGGANPHHPLNLLHLNDACHRGIHDHPERSYDEGTMRRRNR